MKHIFYFLGFILIFLLTIWKCSPSSNPNPENANPTILELTANPDTVDTEDTSILTCNASDSDGDELTFVWESISGSINGSGNNVTWLSPDIVGTYYVICKVLDGNGGEATNSVKIVVEQKIPVEGLVAYYPFNGNANDESGNSNNGTVFGAILVLDRFGASDKAYSFDGTNDYIKASSNNLPTGIRTTGLWFYVNSFGSKAQSLLGYGGNGGPPGTSWFLNINSGSFRRALHYGTNELAYITTISAGQWYFFAVTTEQSGSKIYVDGELGVSNGIFINNTYVTNKDLSIGVTVGSTGIAPYTDGNIGYFNGIIDDVRIYDRALSDEEIQILYHEGGWAE